RLLRDGDERILEAEPGQHADRMRAEVDAAADRLELRHDVVELDAGAEADRVQRQRQRQSADAAADDQDVAGTRLRHVRSTVRLHLPLPLSPQGRGWRAKRAG